MPRDVLLMRLNSCAKEQSQQNSPHFPTLLNPFAASLDEPEMKIFTTISTREKPMKQFHIKRKYFYLSFSRRSYASVKQALFAMGFL